VTGESFKYLLNLESLELNESVINTIYLKDLPNLKKIYLRSWLYLTRPDIETVIREFQTNICQLIHYIGL